jgi:beta-mannanase
LTKSANNAIINIGLNYASTTRYPLIKGRYRAKGSNILTQTIQPCSWAFISNADNNLEKDKTANFQFEDNMSLFLSVCDSLNKLNEKLSRLDYVLKRIIIEAGIYQVIKGETK